MKQKAHEQERKSTKSKISSLERLNKIDGPQQDSSRKKRKDREREDKL